MSAPFSVFCRARRAWLKTAAAAMALIPTAPVLARVAPVATDEFARAASASSGDRMTPHARRYYRSVVGLYR
jgi:hypothetical protein